MAVTGARMTNYMKDRVTLLKCRTAPGALAPSYERYLLENVMVRERFAADADGENGGGAVVYLPEGRYVCRNAAGAEVPLPVLSKGDRCILREGTENEGSLRVAEAEYFRGGALAHIRLRLK